MVVWLDFKKVTAIKEAQKKNPKFISAASVDQPINSDSVEISGGFKDKKALKSKTNRRIVKCRFFTS